MKVAGIKDAPDTMRDVLIEELKLIPVNEIEDATVQVTVEGEGAKLLAYLMDDPLKQELYKDALIKESRGLPPADLDAAIQREEEKIRRKQGHKPTRRTSTTSGDRRIVPTEGEVRDVHALSIKELFELEIEPPQLLLGPWLRESDLVMVHAMRGIGKTWFGMSVALALATGTDFLGAEASKPRGVLYVDGEMKLAEMKERFKHLVVGLDPDCEIDDIRLRLLSLEHSSRTRAPMHLLDTEEGQYQLEGVVQDASLVVIDNISTLLPTENENDAAQWSIAQNFLLKLRRAGVTVVVIHHSGKGGQQRGTSRREDVLDVVLKLERPSNYDHTEDCRIEIKFEKSRGLKGSETNTIDAQLIPGEQGGLTWTWQAAKEAKEKHGVSLLMEGMRCEDVAKELGVSRATVFRWQKKARDKGILQ
jgi:KaiC/GvpD/RAD55 family RecA-like ATPase